MNTPRARLERELWRAGVRVGVLPPVTSPSVHTFPIHIPDGASAADVDKHLPDIAGRLSVRSLRGAWRHDGLYGVEMPRERRDVVTLGDVDIPNTHTLPIVFGIDVNGAPLVGDLVSMPHLAAAGFTGSGKSVWLHTVLCSLITKHPPERLRLVLADAKIVELSQYSAIPHLLTPVIQDAPALIDTLQHLQTEMNQRYKMLAAAGCRDIDTYNRKHQNAALAYIVCIIDELADFMTQRDERRALAPVLESLAQKGRAAGVHLLLATQRPSDDVGMSVTLRANIPARVSFALPDSASSRAALAGDASAANLLGKGDGLALFGGKLTRFQSAFIDEHDITRAVNQACEHDVPSWQLTELQPMVHIDESLSPYERAMNFIQGEHWVNASDLVKAGVCKSETKGRYLIQDLRAAGLVGEHDTSRKASPVHQHPANPRDGMTGADGSVTGKKRVRDRRDASDAFIAAGVRVMN